MEAGRSTPHRRTDESRGESPKDEIENYKLAIGIFPVIYGNKQNFFVRNKNKQDSVRPGDSEREGD